MRKGFTFVELLIVMAILVILAAVAVPGAAGMIERADAQRDKANALLIVDAINTFNSLHPGSKLLTKPGAWTDAAAAMGDLWPEGMSASRAAAAYTMVTVKNGHAALIGGSTQ